MGYYFYLEVCVCVGGGGADYLSAPGAEKRGYATGF